MERMGLVFDWRLVARGGAKCAELHSLCSLCVGTLHRTMQYADATRAAAQEHVQHTVLLTVVESRVTRSRCVGVASRGLRNKGVFWFTENI